MLDPLTPREGCETCEGGCMDLPPPIQALVDQIWERHPEEAPALARLQAAVVQELHNPWRQIAALQEQLLKEQEKAAFSTLELLDLKLEVQQMQREATELRPAALPSEFPVETTATDHAEILHVQRLAYQDSVTGLPNHLLGTRCLSQQLAQAGSGEGCVALAVLDIHGLRNLNGYLGHALSNEFLRALSRRISQGLSPQDVLLRGRDDEFWVIFLCPDRGPLGLKKLTTEVRGCLNRLQEGLHEPLQVEDQSVLAVLDCGVACSLGEDSVDTLVERALLATDAAKSTGRVSFYQPEMDKPIQARKQLLPLLRQALEKGQFELRYQPIMKLPSLQVTAIECYLRWMHPIEGLVGPEFFLKAACQSGLIVPIGEWVVNKACALSKSLPDHYVCINVSAQELLQGDFIKRLMRVLQTAQMTRPDQIVIEVAETHLASDNPRFFSILKEIRRWNVQIAIDDFTFDNFSLRRLEEIQCKFLKVGPEVAQNIDRPVYKGLLRGAVMVADSLGCRVIAEGVENARQLELLVEQGCHWGQGLWLSPLKTLAELEDSLKPIL